MGWEGGIDGVGRPLRLGEGGGGWEVEDFGCLWAQYASHRVWQKGRVFIVNSWSAEVRQCWGMEHVRDM